MATNNKLIDLKTFNGGLHTDNSPVNQPDNTWRYALNLVDETTDGDVTFVSNERSNVECSQYPQGFIPIGYVYINDNRNVVFLVSEDGITSEIGIVTNNCTYESLVTSECLNFNEHYQIDATFRVRLSCEDTIYWVDGLNNDRYYNIQKPENFYTEEYLEWLTNGGGGTPPTKFDCSKFDLEREYSVPSLTNLEVLTGGTINSGTYNFAIRYLDADLNPTNWIFSSQLVPIYVDNLNSPFNSIDGSSNLLTDPTGGSNPTDKLIKFQLNQLDHRFEYYQIAVIEASSFNEEVSRVLISEQKPITETIFYFDGNILNYTLGTKEELEYKKSNLSISQHIEQLENRLVLANLKGRKIDWCSFQKSASKIATNYVIKEFDLEDITSNGNPKNPNTYFEFESYLGDEVYAFGIVYVFKDGLESPAYHIPGRPFNTYWNNGTVVTTDDSNWQNENCDTSVTVDRAMQFYQSSVPTSTYKNLLSCNDSDYWGVDFAGNPLVDQPIRHHKFPSRSKEVHYSNTSNPQTNTDDLKLYITLTYDIETSCVVYTGPFKVNLSYYDNTNTLITINNVYSFPSLSVIPLDDVLIATTVPYDANFISIEVVDNSNTVISNDCLTAEVRTNNSNLIKGNLIGRNLGIEFDNITYPHPDIVGHYFVRANRDDFNRTILDKGIAGITRSKFPDKSDRKLNSFTWFTSFLGSIDKKYDLVYLFNPNFLYWNKTNKPSKLKIENSIINYDRRYAASEYDDPNGSNFWGTDQDNIIEHRAYYYGRALDLIGDCNTKTFNVDKYTYLNPVEYHDSLITGERVWNTSMDNKVQFLTLPGQSFFWNNNDLMYTSLKVERDVHSSLFNLKYQRIHNNMLDLSSSQVCYGGDVFISNFDLTNGTHRKRENGIGTKILIVLAAIILALVAIFIPPVGAVISTLYGALAAGMVIAGAAIAMAGAIYNFIDAMMLRGLEELQEDQMFENLDPSGRWTSDVFWSNEQLVDVFIETEINTYLRQHIPDSSGCQGHIDQDSKYTNNNLSLYFKNKWLYSKDPDNPEDLYLRSDLPQPCPEVYWYNKDFSRENLQSIYFPLPATYDCCSDCLEEFPTRVKYSQQSFQEERTDNYRSFLANNYRDIEGEMGEITDLFTLGSSLMIHSEEALWQLPASLQERVTNEIISFIGTGDFFSTPLKKVTDSNVGASGTINKWATLKVRNEVYFLSEREHSIYVFNGSVNEISLLGNKHYFRNNLKEFLNNQFITNYGIEYPYLNNNCSSKGVGIHSTYDPKVYRVIFTKLDYLMINPAILITDNNLIVDNRLYFNTETNTFYSLINNLITEVELTNELYFENKSWTMSFSLKKKWLSYHSYLPNMYCYDNDHFYSFINSSNFSWKHDSYNRLSYQTYYNKYYPHIIEYISNKSPIDTLITDDITFQTIAQSYDTQSDDWLNERYITFNNILLSNERQCSGELEMIVKDTEVNINDYLSHQISNRINNNEILITREERNWNINDLRDIRINYNKPIFKTKWIDIRSTYPIDKVVDLTTIDYNKNWYELESFRDKHISIRLKFFKEEHSNINLIYKYNLITSQDSYR